MSQVCSLLPISLLRIEWECVPHTSKLHCLNNKLTWNINWHHIVLKSIHKSREKEVSDGRHNSITFRMTFYIYFSIIACSFLEYSYISPKLWEKCVKCNSHESAFFAQFGEKHLVCCEIVKREQQLGVWG